MSNSEKSLQKLTDLQIAQEFLSQKKLTMKGFWKLTKPQQDLLNEEINRRINTLTGERKDMFVAKLNGLLDKEDKNQLWQHNHTRIQTTLSNLLMEYNRMPTVDKLAQQSGVSRQTVYKHLKHFNTQKQYKEEWDRIRYASISIFATVAKCALKGDMKAARLYFDIIDNSGGEGRTYIKNQVNNQQNHYLTINSVKLDEPTLNSMPVELLQQIEEFVKNRQAKKIDISNK